MSFISDYLLTTEGTEPCLEYHVWCMMNTLSVYCGKRFWFNLGHLRYYPHLYVILVGDPGSRKTTAMNFSRDMVRDSGVSPVSATQITKEALTQVMSSTIDGKPKKAAFIGQKTFPFEGKMLEYNQYSIFASELVDFIGVNPLGFLDFLTAVWDAPVIDVVTKNKGVDFVENPCINFLACLTPSRMKGFMKQNILGAGYARRTAFVFSAHKKIIPRPTRTQEQIDAYTRCVEFGKQIQSLSGPFDWTPEVSEFYDEWYTENQKELRDKHPNTQGWYETKPEILFKLSMLIAISETQERMITLPVYKMAMRYCELLEKNLERVFEGSGINPNSSVASQICRMLEQMDVPMNKKHLEMLFFDQATDLNALRDTLTHLINVGRLKEVVLTKNGTGEVLGSVIAPPECLSRYSPEALVAFLKRPVAPSRPVDTGCSAELRLSQQPTAEPRTGSGSEDQTLAEPVDAAESAEALEVQIDLSIPLNPTPDSPSSEPRKE